ncbi:MAG: hypothetical protein A2V60_03615 [Candidatus Portnoybacteria bacterium RIFCSPHIGHO2_01_FULL_39_19]|nr:MAG: hypothetical protein A2V60_03615 [Candidatus Portnoybacteria bacterium RIFCSPHIGHO2_01_FULL_39_19]
MVEAGETILVPDAAVEVVHEALQLEALIELQVNVLELPETILVGLAVTEQVGGAAIVNVLDE